MHAVLVSDAVWEYLVSAAAFEKRSVSGQIAQLAADALEAHPIPVARLPPALASGTVHCAQVLLALARANPAGLLMRELETALRLSHLPVAKAVQTALNSEWVQRTAVVGDTARGRRAYRYRLILTPVRAIKLVYENMPAALTPEERLGIQEDLFAGLGVEEDNT